jgi:hypothetical protein
MPLSSFVSALRDSDFRVFPYSMPAQRSKATEHSHNASFAFAVPMMLEAPFTDGEALCLLRRSSRELFARCFSRQRECQSPFQRARQNQPPMMVE